MTEGAAAETMLDVMMSHQIRRPRTDGQQNRSTDRETASDFLTVVVPLLFELVLVPSQAP